MSPCGPTGSNLQAIDLDLLPRVFSTLSGKARKEVHGIYVFSSCSIFHLKFQSYCTLFSLAFMCWVFHRGQITYSQKDQLPSVPRKVRRGVVGSCQGICLPNFSPAGAKVVSPWCTKRKWTKSKPIDRPFTAEWRGIQSLSITGSGKKQNYDGVHQSPT